MIAGVLFITAEPFKPWTDQRCQTSFSLEICTQCCNCLAILYLLNIKFYFLEVDKKINNLVRIFENSFDVFGI